MRALIALSVCTVLAACGSGSDTVTVDEPVAVVPTDPTTPTQPANSVWQLNTNEQRSAHVPETASGLGALVNVQSVTDTTVNGNSYTLVTSFGVPDYQVTINQSVLDELTLRPRANTDFTGGSPLIDIGDTVAFGQDIGYVSNRNCGTDTGYGYWPPGPDCPTDDYREGYFPKQPQAGNSSCATGLGKVGLWVNGSSVYNWGDGMTYRNQGAWNNLAPIAEGYDVDICGGHAANGDYHHHFYSSCLADMVGDKADGHSPLYGFAADGYPIYGPWQASGVLAISSWIARDYSADTVTGCSDGARSCALVDQYDVTKGTTTVSAGPAFTATVSTLSGNQLTAFNGYYLQDYYWDASLTSKGGAYLDQYNGHTDEERGYHYHVTVSRAADKLVPAFPYIIGLRFAGELHDSALANCSTGSARPGS
ncbi:YHYH protein [Rheinheimera baltica]|uniref:YHYH protein n=1 Tax=Rheinheimera baltica TaxID=67576 RepID=A0ABT9I496_9GAMM|nr:YHYH protein [Rheinheimera baltica]MDP5138205.1 YHYH protein [Rheinheimera baltica]MDP5141141.1 YHYH protein [Rheinheimera baltica]MDP5148370.1 YHYH protein [Rheinheimera baltica]MDP5191338.1 YHYH protein [Rheinheimera baltica]